MQIGITGAVVVSLERGFASVAGEIALTRTALVEGLSAVSRGVASAGAMIATQIDQVKGLLVEQVDLMKNAHENDARQFFEDGWEALTLAESEPAVRESLLAFHDGIQKKRTGVQNRFGAASAYEVLRDYDNAGQHYAFAFQFAREPGLKSRAKEGTARVAHRTGDVPNALIEIDTALTLDPENASARYAKVHYQAILCDTDGAVDTALGLIESAPDYYEVFVRDTELMLDGRVRADCLRQLYQRRKFRGPDRLYLLCRDLLMLGDANTASEVFADLFSVNPEYLRQSRVWNTDQAGHLRTTGVRLLQTFVGSPEQNTNFAYSALATHLGADNTLLAQVFLIELTRRTDFLIQSPQNDELLLSGLLGVLHDGTANFLRTVQPHVPERIASRISLLLSKIQP